VPRLSTLRDGVALFHYDGRTRGKRLLEATIDSPIIVLTPVFNDWCAAGQMLADLDDALSRMGRRAEVVLVNDGSSEAFAPAEFRFQRKAIARIWRLDLRRNVGHQRAIAVGLAHLHKCAKFGSLVVMDADGEDLPEDACRLVARFEELAGATTVFAERTKRSEGPLFAFLYWLYRSVHRLLTGVRVRVGNFSVLPRGAVERLVLMPELWNHYAASVFKSRLAYDMIRTERGRRLSGRSSMNFVSLVVHGLAAISVFGDVVGVRLLIISGVLLALSAAVLVVAIAGGLPAWTAVMAGVMMLAALQGAALSLFFVFGTLSLRQGASFNPERECGAFVAGMVEVGVPEGGP
jgi:hypothetical protein